MLLLRVRVRANNLRRWVRHLLAGEVLDYASKELRCRRRGSSLREACRILLRNPLTNRASAGLAQVPSRTSGSKVRKLLLLLLGMLQLLPLSVPRILVLESPGVKRSVVLALKAASSGRVQPLGLTFSEEEHR